MSMYLVQASYSTAATAAMLKKPQDRAAAMRPVIRRMGGKLVGMWFCFGEYDVVAVVDVPDNVSAAALSMAIGARGGVSAFRTTPLLSTDEAVAAMKKARGAGYQPPK